LLSYKLISFVVYALVIPSDMSDVICALLLQLTAQLVIIDVSDLLLYATASLD